MTTPSFDEGPENPRPDLPAGSSVPQPPAPIRMPVQFPAQRPFVTSAILAITVAVFLLQSLTGVLFGKDYPALLGMKVNAFIQMGQLWRLFTPLLLHGSIMHIAFNMYALYSIGRSLERYYGHTRFLLLYLVAGFTGNVVSFLFTSANSLGASTAIFGLIAAEGVFILKNRSLFGKQQSQRMISNIGMIILINLMLGLNPGIDNMGHLGGLMGGLAYAWLAGPIIQVRQDSFGLQLADERPARQMWVAAFGVMAIFSIAVAANLLLM